MSQSPPSVVAVTRGCLAGAFFPQNTYTQTFFKVLEHTQNRRTTQTTKNIQHLKTFKHQHHNIFRNPVIFVINLNILVDPKTRMMVLGAHGHFHEFHKSKNVDIVDSRKVKVSFHQFAVKENSTTELLALPDVFIVGHLQTTLNTKPNFLDFHIFSIRQENNQTESVHVKAPAKDPANSFRFCIS